MTVELIAPALVAVAVSALSGWLRRRLPPRAAVVLLTAVAVASATAVVWGLVLVVIGGLLGVPDVLRALSWCERVARAGHEAHPIVAGAAALTLTIGVVRYIGFERRWRRTLRRATFDDPITVIDARRPIAYALPGRPGTIVLSQGLLETLDDDERAAVLTHERCHLDRGHYRFLRLAGAAAAVVPILAPLARHVRFATEREADEAAASAVGDRRIVARAIATAALGPTVVPTALAAAAYGVSDRITELIHPDRRSWVPAAAVIAALAALLTGLLTTTLQVHHLLAFGLHVCGLD